MSGSISQGDFMTVKILIVHSIYQNFHLSGENNVVEMQADFLNTLEGVEVKIVNQKIVSNHMTLSEKFKTAMRVASGYGENPLKKAQGFNPSLVIVHNLFPNFGTRWLTKVDIPTILYVHNYRNFCASGNFFRESKICNLCTTKNPLQAMKYSCYKNSRLASLPLVIKQIREKSRGPQVSQFVKYICVSAPIFSAYEKSGVPIKNIATLNNFVASVGSTNFQIASSPVTSNWVALGRLVEEKGFAKLIENWPDGFMLDIIGDGPDRHRLEKLIEGHSNIRILGTASRSEVSEKLPTYSGAIIPSIWSEGSPLTEIEFYRAGLPVIQIDRPGKPVDSYYDNNLLIPYQDFMNIEAKLNLANAMNYVLVNRLRLSNQSRHRFEDKYSSNAWLKGLNRLLEDWFGFSISQ
jgi:glycosyltransferase involved in cell wall biosynthesis